MEGGPVGLREIGGKEWTRRAGRRTNPFLLHTRTCLPWTTGNTGEGGGGVREESVTVGASNFIRCEIKRRSWHISRLAGDKVYTFRGDMRVLGCKYRYFVSRSRRVSSKHAKSERSISRRIYKSLINPLKLIQSSLHTYTRNIEFRRSY